MLEISGFQPYLIFSKTFNDPIVKKKKGAGGQCWRLEAQWWGMRFCSKLEGTAGHWLELWEVGGTVRAVGS